MLPIKKFRIKVCPQNSNRGVIAFYIKPTQKFRKWMEKYATETRAEREHLRFFHKETELLENDTIESKNLTEIDEVRVRVLNNSSRE